MLFRVITTGKTSVLCTLHLSRSSGSLCVWKDSPNLLPCMYLLQERKPKTDNYHGLVPESCVTLNPPGVSENWSLKKTIGPAIAMKKKTFSPLLPTELVECILTETKQVCQDLCRQNYAFTNNKQICS